MTLKEIYELRKENATDELVNRMGWTGYKASVDEIKRTTVSLTEGFRKAFCPEHAESIAEAMRVKKEELAKSFFWNHVNFSAENKWDSEYGKTFCRILFSGGNKSYTVIYNMSGSGAKYVIFEADKAVPLKKFRKMQELGKFLKEAWV